MLTCNQTVSARISPANPLQNFTGIAKASDAEVFSAPTTSLNEKPYAVHNNTNTPSTTKPVTSSSPPLTCHSTTDLRTQTMHKILALLDELQELMLCLLQLVSSHALCIALPCLTTDPLTHLTQLNTTQPLNQTSLNLPVNTQPMIMPPLKKVHSSWPPLSHWPPPQCYTGSVLALPTPHLKHVCFKINALHSPGYLLSWHKEDMCPP